jgi:Domain of unknown function (DUF4263)
VTGFPSVSDEIEGLLRGVDHEATSPLKYRHFERYLGELLDIPESAIYTAHVAKPGNFDVRMTQSKRAREAQLRVALVPRERDFGFVVGLAARIAGDEYPGTAALVVPDWSGRWTPRWGIEPQITGEHPSDDPFNLSRFRSWFYDFELRTYPYAPPDQSAQARLDALLTDIGELLSQLPGLPAGMLRDSLAQAEVPQTFYRLNPRLYANFIENDVTADDVVAIAHRRSVVEGFRRLLEDPQFFSDEAAAFNGRKEAVWQDLLENNPWILGVSLAGQVLTSWSEDKLEQVVAGFSVGGPGKRTDALMHTSGRIRALVFAEIKHHETKLLGEEYRTGAWAPSSELSGGVTQVQQTVHLASRQIGERLSETDESGAETGEHTYLVRPRSFLILGNLEQLRGPGGVHRAKYESFELYRRNLYEPEIITFDELLARAEWHVEALDERS